ncbi:MAG: hypothetical protein CO029_04465 [Candidatus Magasanikbacteria bacterium CG_4_9_14_0_2_um_filter_41_10]|uniref:HAD family hydrolase n=1 Tax=Candidatus Magasanikbacteria bacterium CG_4_10_14_0_2_um_filter_41_31 TaxID=1974639 RepID=A0A2M7V1N8_9BACT|nr:MAG: hypothetical protein AUJ37_03920 [Candidatus Magasanikbacteria bacterium CG1_02_41_34]PIZ92244.1 MAG: hypothetical protein COX83_04815 [Candidatus Magasanikbacteria bacterium CG_4_10_14_0_2_um_filter_41_31]PJC53112.1 MAG: hypothetical protein CO029_04465 [Candidatus Magasanikbacteria bacterium CG_4_9_14_0_2_um_filter_41_10]
MNVVFDFDNTLFEAERLKFALYGFVETYGFSQEDAKEMYRLSRDLDGHVTFSPERFCEVLNVAIEKKQQGTSVDPSFVREHLMHHVGVVTGAIELLTLLKEKNISMYLLSLGVSEWQHEKVKMSGIDVFFASDRIHYTTHVQEGKIIALRSIFGENFTGENTYLFNDKPDETKVLLASFPELHVYLRCDVTDMRYVRADFDELVNEYGDRAMYADDLTHGAAFLHIS